MHSRVVLLVGAILGAAHFADAFQSVPGLREAPGALRAAGSSIHIPQTGGRATPSLRSGKRAVGGLRMAEGSGDEEPDLITQFNRLSMAQKGGIAGLGTALVAGGMGVIIGKKTSDAPACNAAVFAHTSAGQGSIAGAPPAPPLRPAVWAWQRAPEPQPPAGP